MAPFLIVLVAALVVRLLGGVGLKSLAGLRFVGLPVVWAGACMELAVVSSVVEGTAVRLLAYGAIVSVVVFLALNFQLPGMKLAIAGVVLNLAVIAANGAMPVVTERLRSTGAETSTDAFDAGHERADDDTRLALLADRIPLPLADQVISIGDVLLLAGLFLFVARARPRPKAGEAASDGPTPRTVALGAE